MGGGGRACAYSEQVQQADTACLGPGQLGEPIIILMLNYE